MESGQIKFGKMANDSFSRQMYFPTMIFTIECSDAENLNAYSFDEIQQNLTEWSQKRSTATHPAASVFYFSKNLCL